MNPDDTPGNRRQRLIVIPDLQKRLIRQCSAWPFALIAASVLLIGVAWHKVFSEFADSGAELSSLGLLMIAFAALVGVSAFVVLYQSVVYSNRIAGPLHRVHKALESIRAGDYSQRIQLRDRDLLFETADQVNLTLEALQRRHGQAGSPAAATAASGEPSRPLTGVMTGL